MRLEPLTAEHLLEIEWQDSQKPFAHQVTADIAEWWEENGEGLSLLSDDGEVIASAGVAPTRIEIYPDGVQIPAHSMAVAVFSPKFAKHIKLILRAIRDFLNSRPEYRITMHVWPADTKAAHFARRLGFVFERTEYEASLGAFVHLYARVRH
jgi:RimJ/RimL family protein N-acetyltransferase